MQHREGYLHYVHYFRGFAILNIVAIHAAAFAQFVPSGGNIDRTTVFSAINESLFHDATLYFALVSGLLFSVVLKRRGLKTFFRSKLLNVVSPYVFCTLVFSWVFWDLDGSGVFALREGLGAYADVLPKNLLFGEAQFTFWYIPILLMLFAATPVLAAWVGRGGYRSVLIWIIMLLPLAVSRAEFVDGGNQVRLTTFFYFLGAYTAGLYLGDRLEERLGVLRAYWKPLAAVVVATTLALVLLYINDVGRIGWFSIHESLFYVQKISAAVLVLIWFRHLDPARLRWLSPFADAAFSIYFVHAFFMLLVAELAFAFIVNETYQPASIYLMAGVYFFSALALSAACVFLFRKVFGRRSRMLIGS